MTAQVRQIVLELAAVLHRPTDAIDSLQHELEELELELAMLDSEVDAAIDSLAAQHHDEVGDRVGALQRALGAAFRALVDDVLAYRAGAPDEAVSLFAELDGLFEQYRTL